MNELLGFVGLIRREALIRAYIKGEWFITQETRSGYTLTSNTPGTTSALVLGTLMTIIQSDHYHGIKHADVALKELKETMDAVVKCLSSDALPLNVKRQCCMKSFEDTILDIKFHCIPVQDTTPIDFKRV